ncbi:MAG: hypothetical protein ABI972_20025 [Acidobacteriota bacterium]
MKAFTLCACLVAAAQAQSPSRPGWWMTEPIRWVQTNLRQTDAALDAARLAQQLADMRANVVLMSMGGIVAYYPTQTEFHYPSPDLPPGRDMFGDVVREAHARKIRVVGRYDLSKTSKAVFDAHPEWFFRQGSGEPVVYNGLYSTCINGGYYRSQAMKILTEGLEKFDVDGLFFNMFGNQSRDYSGNYVGLCHCDSCQRLYKEKFGKPVPDTSDDDYRKFMFSASREVAAAIGDLIHAKRPKAGYFNYIQEFSDGIMSESNTALARPLPLWPYSASDRVNRARNSQPNKMAVNLNMQFVDYWWRFATVPAGEIELRSWQNVAHGGALTFEVNGTLDLQDRKALEAVKPIFQRIADDEQYYIGQTSAARVLLLGAPANTGRTYSEESYRGAFRLLSEGHIPFAVSDNMDWLGKRNYDLVVATNWAPPELKQYAEAGGKVLILDATPPEFDVAPVVRTTPDLRGYIRIRDRAKFEALRNTDLLMLTGPFTEVTATEPAQLTLIPPSMFGPPEFVHIDMHDTDTPAIVRREIGKGTVIWLPWNLAAIYYRLSLPSHAGLFRDLVRFLHPRRQIETSAHPLVEMSFMEQKEKGRSLLHLINLSGTSQTGYFQPVPMDAFRVNLSGRFTRARAIRSGKVVPLTRVSDTVEFTVPPFNDYELIVLYR